MKLHLKAAWKTLIGKTHNSTEDDPIEEKESNTLWSIVIAILVCLGVFFSGIYLTTLYANSSFPVGKNDNAPALFGDSFGGVNALISAFAFAGVIVSMYLQRKDLSLQRKSIIIQQEELRQNTNELALQRQEFETQNKTLKIQRFETTFFNMLSLQQEIVNGLEFTSEGKHFKGRSCCLELWENIDIELWVNIDLGHGDFVETNIMKTILIRGLKGSIEYEGIDCIKKVKQFSIFDHYFRHLYRIVKYIDETPLLDSKQERYSYIANVRATLSKHELLLLYYNSLNPNYKRFKLLIEEYSLFNNIDFSSLSSKSIPNDDYEQSAFNSDILGYNKLS